MAPRVNVETTFDVDIAMQDVIEFTRGEKVSMSKIEQIKADKSIVLRIPDELTENEVTPGYL